jgi:hypothetical protein
VPRFLFRRTVERRLLLPPTTSMPLV